MFATFSSPPPVTASSPFSSPLSAHNVNIPARRSAPMSREKHHTPESKRTYDQTQYSPTLSSSSPFFFSSSSSPAQPGSSPTTTTSSPSTYYAQRYGATIRKPADRIASRALSREKRRDEFLNRVRQGREEKMFNARAEQMQRMEYVALKREFFQGIANSAPEVRYDDEDEKEDEYMEDDARTGDRTNQKEYVERAGGDEVPEEVIMEETYFQEYVEELEKAHNGDESGEMPYDDDDDYDNLFANILTGVRPSEAASHDCTDIYHVDMYHG